MRHPVERGLTVAGQADRATLIGSSVDAGCPFVGYRKVGMDRYWPMLNGISRVRNDAYLACILKSRDSVNSFDLFHDRCCLLIDNIMVIYI